MSALDDIRFYFFHNHGYNHEPPDKDSYESTWVSYPNRNFDPEIGHQYYQRHSRMIRLAEELGFDGVAINEHHNTIFSMTPACSVMGGWVAANTSTARILVAGVPINLAYPNRVAEEYAMLDVMSGGRMEFAFPLGTGMEYWSNDGRINPVTSRARFKESLDIILKCWTEDGPFRYDGEFYNYRYLNPWPKPYQKPYPKGFVVGSGSMETVELAVEHGLGYSIVFVPIAHQLRAFERMRELAAKHDRTVTPDDLIVVTIAYVADTDEEAMREARPHIENFFSWSHRVPPKFLLPPGYVSSQEFLRRASDAALAHGTEATWEEMLASARIACGSPQTVADLIAHWAEEADCSRFNIVIEQSDMPEWKVVKSMTLFAQEVIPRIRAKAPGARLVSERQLAAVAGS